MKIWFHRSAARGSAPIRAVFQSRLLLVALLSALVCCTIAQATAQAPPSWQKIASPGENDMIGAMAVTSDGVLFASTQWSGIYRSTDGAQSWQLMPGISDGSFTVELTAAGTDVYRVHEQGVSVTHDNGATWQPLGAQNFSYPQTLFRTPDGTLFVGTNDGVFRTTDNGATWSQSLNGSTVSRIIRDSDHRLFASVTYPAEFGSGKAFADSSGVYRSMDGGATWERTSLLDRYIRTLAASNRIILAGTQEEGGTGRVYRSVDGGGTWTTTTLKDVTTSLTVFSNGMVIATAANSGVHYSDDEGRTWSSANSGIIDVRVMGAARHPNGTLYVFDVWGNLYRSADPIATGMPQRPDAVSVRTAPNPATDDVVFTLAPVHGGPVRVEMFDHLGRPVGTTEHYATVGEPASLVFSVRGMACGVYFYRIATLSSVVYGRLTVAR